MLVYFHIDELNRDSVVASALRKQLHDRGARLIYGSRTSHWLLKYFARLFDAVILPRPLFINNLAYKNHYILYTESVGRVVSTKNALFSAFSLLDQRCMEGDYSELDSIKRLYLWGPDSLDAVRHFDQTLEKKCMVVGHPRLDPDCLKGKSDEVSGKNGWNNN